MNFLENIVEILGLKDLVSKPVYRATLIGDEAGYFENVTEIKSYSEEEIILCLKRGGIVIRGEKLYVKKFCEGDVAVCGREWISIFYAFLLQSQLLSAICIPFIYLNYCISPCNLTTVFLIMRARSI